MNIVLLSTNKILTLLKGIGNGLLWLFCVIIIIPIGIIALLLLWWFAKYIITIIFLGLIAYILGLGLMSLLEFIFKFNPSKDIVYNIACIALGVIILCVIYLCLSIWLPLNSWFTLQEE